MADETKSEGTGASVKSSNSPSEEHLSSLRRRIDNAEFQEIAAEILACHESELEEEAFKQLKKIVNEKPQFGYWTINDAEYDQEYSLAMDLGRLQVFKGSVCSDREQYNLVRRLSRKHPTLVGLNLFDCRRQFVAFLSPWAEGMRRFALVEMARQCEHETSIFLS